METIIGVDFDNTIISYDDIFHQVAIRHGLIGTDIKKSKKDVREAIRQAPASELAWQRLQALVYGPMIPQAKLSKGVKTFFRSCTHRNIRVCIISHKTEFARCGASRINLRRAALSWMEDHRFFEQDGLGIKREDVFFEATRDAKIERIRALQCTHFIDDLPEMFQEPAFPSITESILYDPCGESAYQPGIKVFTTWEDIGHHLFRSRS